MKKTFWALSLMALLGFVGMTACEEEDLGGGGEGGGDVVDPDQCQKNEDCSEGANGFGSEAKKYCVTANTGRKVCGKYDACCADGDAEACDREFDETGECVSKGGHVSECNADTDCDKDLGEVCDKSAGYGVCKKDNHAVQTFKFVRVDDASEDKYTGAWNSEKRCAPTKAGGCENDPGADIDAIVLTKNGTPSYVADVYDYHFGVATEDVKFNKGDTNAPKYATNPLNIVGEPDSISNYGTADASCKLFIDPEEKNCFGDGDNGIPCTDRPFVSLGGPGGYIIVEMQNAIDAGDKLDILEVGDCKMANCDGDSADKCAKSKAVADGVKVFISMSDVYDGDWKVVSDAQTPAMGVVSLEITSAMIQ